MKLHQHLLFIKELLTNKIIENMLYTLYSNNMKLKTTDLDKPNYLQKFVHITILFKILFSVRLVFLAAVCLKEEKREIP